MLRGVSVVVVDFLWLAGSRERLLIVWRCGVSSVAGLASVIHRWDSRDASLAADIVMVVRYGCLERGKRMRVEARSFANRVLCVITIIRKQGTSK